MENGIPGYTGVAGFPHAAINRAEIKCGSAAGNPGDGRRSSAAIRANQSPLQAAEQFGRDRLCGNGMIQKKCGENKNGGTPDTSCTMTQSKVLYLQSSVRIDYTFAGRGELAGGR